MVLLKEKALFGWLVLEADLFLGWRKKICKTCTFFLCTKQPAVRIKAPYVLSLEGGGVCTAYTVVQKTSPLLVVSEHKQSLRVGSVSAYNHHHAEMCRRVSLQHAHMLQRSAGPCGWHTQKLLPLGSDCDECHHTYNFQVASSLAVIRDSLSVG